MGSTLCLGNTEAAAQAALFWVSGKPGAEQLFLMWKVLAGRGQPGRSGKGGSHAAAWGLLCGSEALGLRTSQPSRKHIWKQPHTPQPGAMPAFLCPRPCSWFNFLVCKGG